LKKSLGCLTFFLLLPLAGNHLLLGPNLLLDLGLTESFSLSIFLSLKNWIWLNRALINSTLYININAIFDNLSQLIVYI
jgi:hypothetical protein